MLGKYIPADVIARLKASQRLGHPLWGPNVPVRGQLRAHDLTQQILRYAEQAATCESTAKVTAATVEKLAQPPWVVPPDGFESFDFAHAIETPENDGQVYDILTFQVPAGYDGIIRRLSHCYTGGGFAPGAGDLVWRIAIDGRPVRNYDAITIQFGDETHQRQIDGIRIYDGQLVAYQVIHSPSSTLPREGTYIIASMAGWFYPRGTK